MHYKLHYTTHYTTYYTILRTTYHTLHYTTQDIHHGNGTQQEFYSDPEVRTSHGGDSHVWFGETGSHSDKWGSGSVVLSSKNKMRIEQIKF